MKINTYYIILDDNKNRAENILYQPSEYEAAKKDLMNKARAFPGKKFHLVKHISSCVANDLVFEDSE